MRRALIALCGAACGCSGASPDLGYGNDLVVAAGQFRPGAFPSPSGGPATISVTQTHTGVVIGEVREPITAVFEGTATGAILGIAGEPGNWIATTQPPDIEMPGDATLAATIGLSADMAQRPFTLELAAVDAAGRIGAPATLDYMAVAAPPPTGELVVTLLWDSTADLDLHVVDPLGGEAWSQHPSTYITPQPGSAVDPTAYLASGWLDRDANADCVQDGAPSEHVVWTTRQGPDGPVTPIIPPGTYTVRVDTRSMCEDASASWYVEADDDGSAIGAARGIAVPDDVLAPHGAGAGVTALTFELP